VVFFDIEDDGISFEEKMEKLSAELKTAFTKGRELEKQIEANLKELGF
jgi:type I restriction enzyme M protein